jgi:hypothetical protein
MMPKSVKRFSDNIMPTRKDGIIAGMMPKIWGIAAPLERPK